MLPIFLKSEETTRKLVAAAILNYGLFSAYNWPAYDGFSCDFSCVPSSTLNVDDVMLSLIIQDKDLQTTPINLVCKSWHAACMHDIHLRAKRAHEHASNAFDKGTASVKEAHALLEIAGKALSQHKMQDPKAVKIASAFKALLEPSAHREYQFANLASALTFTSEEAMRAKYEFVAAFEWYHSESKCASSAASARKRARDFAIFTKDRAAVAYAAR